MKSFFFFFFFFTKLQMIYTYFLFFFLSALIFSYHKIVSFLIYSHLHVNIHVQWKLIITRSLGPQNFVCYIRYFVILVVNKQYKTKEINSMGPEKLVCYIRYFVISDLFISSFHCIVFITNLTFVHFKLDSHIFFYETYSMQQEKYKPAEKNKTAEIIALSSFEQI